MTLREGISIVNKILKRRGREKKEDKMENKKKELLKGTSVCNSFAALHVFLGKTEKLVYTVEVFLKL